MQEEYTWAERWAHLLIDWRERFAVAAPGRVELDENVLASQHNLVKGVGRHDLDGAAVVLGRLLALNELLHLASLRACILQCTIQAPPPMSTTTRFSCLEARCVCRQAAVKAAKILPLVGLARSKQHPINPGHGAQYLYPPPPAGAMVCLEQHLNHEAVWEGPDLKIIDPLVDGARLGVFEEVLAVVLRVVDRDRRQLAVLQPKVFGHLNRRQIF